MDERRRRAWAALGIGPAWLLRDPAARSDPEDGSNTETDSGTAARGASGVDPDTGRDSTSEPRLDPTFEPMHESTFEPMHEPTFEPMHEPTSLPMHEPTSEPTSGQPVVVARSRAPASLREPAIAGLPWQALSEAVSECRACGLCEGRRNTVFGTGPRPASWMLVGEAPGQQEDLSGEPFVGAAGQLLDQMLRAIGIDRASEAFIANVLKCRPPANRDPLPDEVARCEPYLLRQVELLEPRLIIVMGRFAAQSLLRTDATVGSLRGRVHTWRAGDREVPLVVTYHPAYLLRNLPDKSKAWADLRLARRTFDALG